MTPTAWERGDPRRLVAGAVRVAALPGTALCQEAGAFAILSSVMFNRLFRREKLDQGVEKSRSGFFGRIRSLLTAERPIDDDLWDELEELLIQADVGVQLTDDLMKRMRAEHRAGEIQHSRDLFEALKDALASSLEDVAEAKSKAPLVQRGTLSCILVVGVNGVGKTTTIAKLGNF